MVTFCVCPATLSITASLAVVLAETAFLIAYVLAAPAGRYTQLAVCAPPTVPAIPQIADLAWSALP